VGGRRAALALVLLAVGAYYLWAVRAAGYGFEWRREHGGYYDLLARGFAAGHLYVPMAPSPELLRMKNPWDPHVDDSIRMQDMALYGGHYYLYFGAAPAVVLFWPWRALTHHDLPENFALFVLCFGGFLFSAAALGRLLQLAEVKVRWPLEALMLLALGVCQGVPYLLNRVWVYEIAIGGGYFFLAGAVYLLARGLGAKRGALWMATAGMMFGMAMGSRPHLALAAVVAGVWLVRRCGLFSRKAAAFAAGFTAVALAVGIYNFERFGNALEFGFRYQVAGPGQNRIGIAATNLAPGAFYMLFCPPRFSAVFPWVRMVFRHPGVPADYFAEPTVGALWIAPFAAAAFLLVWRSGKGMSGLLRTIALSVAVVALFLISTHLATQRYEVDFLPMAVLAALAGAAGYLARASGWRRRLVTAVLAVVVAYSAIANLALGLTGPYDEILKNRPAGYVRLARWFSPLREFRPLLDPPIDLEWNTVFRPKPAGFREPLVTIGERHHGWSLWAEHEAAGLRVIAQTGEDAATADLRGADVARVGVKVSYTPGTHRIAVWLNGQPALEQRIDALVTAPAEVTLGESRVAPDATDAKFTGTIDVLRRRVGED
jgi:hypothetical protein